MDSLAVSGWFLLRNSFWLRRAENRLLSVGSVLSQLRMMSGRAAPSVLIRIAFQRTDAVRHLVELAHLQRIAYLDVHLPGFVHLAADLGDTALTVAFFREYFRLSSFTRLPTNRSMPCSSMYTGSVGAL